MVIRITGCRDSLMWYAKLVGHEFPVQAEDSEGYWCREPAGFLNVVRRGDAEVVS